LLQCLVSNAIGNVVGPLSGEWLPRRRTGTPSVRHARRHDRQRLGELKAGQVGAEAVVHATAEGLHRRGTIAGDVEAGRAVVDVGIAVGRGGVCEKQGARRNHDSGEFDVVYGRAEDTERDRRMARTNVSAWTLASAYEPPLSRFRK
jgi:hypothetical protein